MGAKALFSLLGLLFLTSTAAGEPTHLYAARDLPERGKVRTDTPSGFPVPRFVVVKKRLAYGRTGPSKDHPVKWELKRRWMPLEVIAETKNWRKVRDAAGDEMWVYSGLLDGRRHGLVLGEDPVTLRKFAFDDAPAAALIEPGLVVRLRACTGDWCFVEAHRRKGWAPQTAFWGVYADDVFDDRSFSKLVRGVDGS